MGNHIILKPSFLLFSIVVISVFRDNAFSLYQRRRQLCRRAVLRLFLNFAPKRFHIHCSHTPCRIPRYSEFFQQCRLCNIVRPIPLYAQQISPGCSQLSMMKKTLTTLFFLDAGALFALQLLQIFSLDYYVLIVFNGTWYSRYPNALFLVLNIVLALLFYHTFLNCYKKYKYERSKKTGMAAVENKVKYPVYLNCVTWAAYVIVLFSKIVVIFSNRIVKLVDYDDFMGPQMLKVSRCLL